MFTTSDAHEHLLITTTRLNFTQVFLVFEFSGDNDSSTLTSLEDLGSILLLKSNVFASCCARKAWYFGLQFHRFCQIMDYVQFVQLLFQVIHRYITLHNHPGVDRKWN